MVIIIWCAVFFNAQRVQAQEIKDYIPTPNTQTGAKPDPKKQGPKEQKVRFIIKNNTAEMLSGNVCFERATRKMGFMYIAMPKGQSPNKNGFTRFMHNFGVKFMIMLKNGPFWKIKVNKKYKDCKFLSGDYTG